MQAIAKKSTANAIAYSWLVVAKYLTVNTCEIFSHVELHNCDFHQLYCDCTHCSVDLSSRVTPYTV